MPLLEKAGKKILFVHVPRTGGFYTTTSFLNSGWEDNYSDLKYPKKIYNIS